MDSFDELLVRAVDDPVNQYLWYKALMDRELVVIGSVAQAPDESVIDTAGAPELQVKYVEMDEATVLPVFTSLYKFREVFSSHHTYVRIPASMLLNVAEPGSFWVLNPGIGPGKTIIPEELSGLMDGSLLNLCWEQLSEQEQKLLLEEQWTALPEDAIDVIAARLQDEPSVRRAYIAYLYHPSSIGKAVPIVGLELEDLDRESAQKLTGSLEARLQQYMGELSIDWIVLDHSYSLARSIVHHKQPFYNRELDREAESSQAMFR